MKQYPKISILICVYNRPKMTSMCLKSILQQEYNGEVEILLIDGGSDKNTLGLLKNYEKKYPQVQIIYNKKRLPEGYGYGKWLGWKKSTGELIAIVDNDNILQNKFCIKNMTDALLQEKDSFGCACELEYNSHNNFINRYISLQGTDPFMAYNSLDGIIKIKKIGKDKGKYILYEIDKKNPIITGGNCFIYKKNILDKLGGYTKDVENINKLIKSNYNKIVISKLAKTNHLAVNGFLEFIRKKKKWAIEYATPNETGSSYLSNKTGRKHFLINLFFISSVIPNIFIGSLMFAKDNKKEWLALPFMKFLTLFIYALNIIETKLKN